MTFTKEQLIAQAQKNIEVLGGAVEKIPGGSDAAVIHLRLAEITLASLEAEPALYCMGGDALDEENVSTRKAVVDGWVDEWNGEGRSPGEPKYRTIPLYTAPPAPVSVPDANGLLPCPYCGGKADFDYDDDNLNWISCSVCGIATDTAYHTDVDAKDKFREVWNRRAAMLQGKAEPVTNLTDGVIATHDEPPECGWVVTHSGRDYFYRAQLDAMTHVNSAIKSDRSVSLIPLQQEPVSQRDELPYDPQIATYEKIMEQAIPDGYVMVPVEPTEKMIAAAMSSDDVLFDTEDDTMFRVQHGAIWEAMLAAALLQGGNNAE